MGVSDPFFYKYENFSQRRKAPGKRGVSLEKSDESTWGSNELPSSGPRAQGDLAEPGESEMLPF